jgi:DNA-binding beta-propeller fold protein YncE
MVVLKRLLGFGCAGVLALMSMGCSDDPAPDIDPCEGQTPGTACTWLGRKGTTGHNHDGLQRWQTEVNQVQDLLFLPDGSAWFTDFNSFLVRKVLPDGTVESVVGWTDPIFPGDGPLGGIPADGAPGADWQLNHPTNLLLAPDGSVIVVAWHNHKILNVDPATGWVKVVCGAGAGFRGDGGPASSALFKQPNDATLDDQGNLYLVDQQNWRVRRIDTADMIDTIAGVGTQGDSGDGGAALDAELSWAAGSNPNPSGGILFHQGKLYVSDTEANRIRVVDLAAGTIDAFAGTGGKGFGGDGGPAGEALLSAPRDLEIGPDGHLYFADTDNGAVRAIDLQTNVIRTVVGTGELGLEEGELLPPTQMQLRRPFGVAFDPAGNLYVMDSLNERIVKVAR